MTMSTADWLRALDQAATVAPWGDARCIDRDDAILIAVARNTLPLVADLIDAANGLVDAWTGPSSHPAGLRVLDALAALDAAVVAQR